MLSTLKKSIVLAMLGFGLMVPTLAMSQQDDSAKQADRWIGVAVGQVPEIVRVHLNVDPSVGVIVLDVVPESPAAKGGLQRHDVITRVNSKDITSLQDLVATIQAAEKNDVQVEWLRGGQSHTTTVTAAPRPAELAPGQSLVPPGFGTPDDPSANTLNDWMSRLRSHGSQGWSFRIPDMSESTPFPQGLSVQIERKNDEPAKIKVQRDGQTWELTENDIDQLPEDLRGHVRRMLGGQGQFQLPGGQMTFKDLDLHMIPPSGVAPGFDADMNKQLEEMNRRMEQMFEELRGLRGEHGHEELAPPPEDKKLELESNDKA